MSLALGAVASPPPPTGGIFDTPDRQLSGFAAVYDANNPWLAKVVVLSRNEVIWDAYTPFLFVFISLALVLTSVYHLVRRFLNNYLPVRLITAWTEPGGDPLGVTCICLLDFALYVWNSRRSKSVNTSRRIEDVSLREWLECKERFLATTMISDCDQEKKNRLFKHLGTIACVLHVINTNGSCESVIENIDNYFLTRQKSDLKRDEFDNYTRKEGESIDAMVETLRKLSFELCGNMRPEDVEIWIRNKVKANLKPFIQQKLRDDGIFSLSETVRAAKLMEFSEQQTRATQQISATQQTPSVPTESPARNDGTSYQSLSSYATAFFHNGKLFICVKLIWTKIWSSRVFLAAISIGSSCFGYVLWEVLPLLYASLSNENGCNPMHRQF